MLGAVLLLGSAVTVLATSNTPPTITSASLSQTTINEGGSVTLSGTFTDPDGSDAHAALIFWPGGEKQKVQIPVGQFTFQASRTFPDNLNLHNVVVEIRDKQLPPGANDNSEGLGKDFKSFTLDVVNVAPTFSHNVTVSKVRNAPGKIVAEGDVVDPGADTVAVFADWNAGRVPTVGDGEPCTMTSTRHFKCEHTYFVSPISSNNTHSIKLTVRDDDGGWTSVTKSIQLP
jgi:hypothetical protein